MMDKDWSMGGMVYVCLILILFVLAASGALRVAF
jgi:hypothetical protein